MDGSNISEIKLIVFDIDGTLAETDDYLIEKGAASICHLFPSVSSEAAQKFVRPLFMVGETVIHSFYRILDLFGMDFLISRFHSKFSIRTEYKFSPVGNMRETLKLLSQYFTLGIISSGGRYSTMAFIKKFDLSECVPFIISAEDAAFIKPHPMPLLQVALKAGVPINQCIMVGDTVFDILCAKRAGAYSVAVKTGFDSSLFLKLHHPDYLLDSVDDLPALMHICNTEQMKAKSQGKPKDLV